MERVAMLREQAQVLRDLAARSSGGIHDKLLALSRQCDELAREGEQVSVKSVNQLDHA